MRTRHIYYWRHVVKTNSGYATELPVECTESGMYHVLSEDDNISVWLREDELKKLDVYYDSELDSNVIFWYSFDPSASGALELLYTDYCRQAILKRIELEKYESMLASIKDKWEKSSPDNLKVVRKKETHIEKTLEQFYTMAENIRNSACEVQKNRYE